VGAGVFQPGTPEKNRRYSKLFFAFVHRPSGDDTRGILFLVNYIADSGLSFYVR
jgi:hypothetical protein